MARQLEREIEKRFDTVFGAVSFHFQELYAELFPGGRATLRLEEPEPPTLDLEGDGPPPAERRPGRRDPRPAARQASDAASVAQRRRARADRARRGAGAATGESRARSTSSTRSTPRSTTATCSASPGCCAGSAPRQQFLVVTHNHITMAAADALWGVTIDADGHQLGARRPVRRGGVAWPPRRRRCTGWRDDPDDRRAPRWLTRSSPRFGEARGGDGCPAAWTRRRVPSAPRCTGSRLPGRKLDDAFYDDLTEVLIAADCGVELSERLDGRAAPAGAAREARRCAPRRSRRSRRRSSR